MYNFAQTKKRQTRKAINRKLVYSRFYEHNISYTVKLAGPSLFWINKFNGFIVSCALYITHDSVYRRHFGYLYVHWIIKRASKYTIFTSFRPLSKSEHNWYWFFSLGRIYFIPNSGQKPSFDGDPTYWISFIELNRQVVEMLRSIQLCMDLPVGYFQKGTSYITVVGFVKELH